MNTIEPNFYPKFFEKEKGIYMSEFSIDELGGLGDATVQIKEKIDPKDEFFHSIYIAGIDRVNEAGIMEEAGRLQIRGVDFNKQVIHMIITHTKNVLVKMGKDQSGRDKTECFSYQNGDPKGTSGNTCGRTSAERAANPYCSTCKSQIILAGILCDEKANPKVKDGKPIFVFIRGKGIKYSGVSDYIKDCQNLKFPPILSGDSIKVANFEKIYINLLRHVTCIGITYAQSAYGQKKVFELKRGELVPIPTIQNVSRIAKKTLDKFNEKFDWSKAPQQQQQSSYFQEEAPPQQESKFTEPQETGEVLNLSDITF